MTARDVSLPITPEYLKALADSSIDLPDRIDVVPAGASLGRGNMQVFKLRQGVLLMAAKLRGVRESRAAPVSNTGFHVEARLAGRSTSQEVGGPERRLTLRPRDLCLAGMDQARSWEVVMSAQSDFQAVSITWSLAFIHSLAETDPELAEAMVTAVARESLAVATLPSSLDPALQSVFDLNDSTPGGALAREALTLTILAGLRPLIVGDASSATGTGPASRLRDQIDLVIGSGSSRIWTVEEIAHALGTSPSTLQKRFRAQEGRAIGTFMTERRLARARDLLRSSRSIGEVAKETGYGSTEAFSKAFRRHFGQSPRQFRRPTL
ncbi:MAG: helix-turn-helix transcriptional regulator [Pseudomonadota bacterium]